MAGRLPIKEIRTGQAHVSLLRYLLVSGNHEHRDEILTLSRANIKFYGVRLSVLHLIMKKWLDRFQPNFDERRRLVQILWEGSSREEKLIALWMVSQENGLLRSVTGNEILSWSGTPDNWEVAEVMSTKILAPWILIDLESRIRYLDILVTGSNYWRSSISISATITLNRLGSISEERTIKMIEKLLPDDHPVVVRAVLSALLDLKKRNPTGLGSFLRKHQEDLHTDLLTGIRRESF